jgi:hypothetical protein
MRAGKAGEARVTASVDGRRNAAGRLATDGRAAAIDSPWYNPCPPLNDR